MKIQLDIFLILVYEKLETGRVDFFLTAVNKR